MEVEAEAEVEAKESILILVIVLIFLFSMRLIFSTPPPLLPMHVPLYYEDDDKDPKGGPCQFLLPQQGQGRLVRSPR